MTKHANLHAAMLAVQSELPVVEKLRRGQVGNQKYDYADLADVSKAILPVLTKNGLYFTSAPTVREDGQVVLNYVLCHEADGLIEGFYPLPAGVRPQELGSAITYARRYALCAVTGLTPGGDDDDGHKAQNARVDADWMSALESVTTKAEARALYKQAQAVATKATLNAITEKASGLPD